MCKANSKTNKPAKCANCSGCKLAAAVATLPIAPDKTVSSGSDNKQGAKSSDTTEPSTR